MILMITVAGVMALFASTSKMNYWQGDSSTRTVEYAQDKMESLLVLDFADTSTDTTVWPYCNATIYLPGTSTPACLPTANNTGLTPGGGTGPAALANPIAGYFDYLTATGDVQTTNVGASYIRVWSITQNAAGNLKTITVEAASINSWGLPVQTTLVCLKSSQK